MTLKNLWAFEISYSRSTRMEIWFPIIKKNRNSEAPFSLSWFIRENFWSHIYHWLVLKTNFNCFYLNYNYFNFFRQLKYVAYSVILPAIYLLWYETNSKITFFITWLVFSYIYFLISRLSSTSVDLSRLGFWNFDFKSTW